MPKEKNARGGGSVRVLFRYLRTLFKLPSRGDGRVAILVWTLAFVTVFGVLEAGEPLEDVVKGVRDTARQQQYAGQVVVVAVDEVSLQALGGFPMSRQHYAAALDRAFAGGAHRAFFDFSFSQTQDRAGDLKFAKALDRYRGQVFIGSMKPTAHQKGMVSKIEPHPMFRDRSRVLSLDGSVTPFGFSVELPGRWVAPEKGAMPLAVALSGQKNVPSGFYRPDWSIDHKTIPTVSMSDLLAGKVSRSELEGKDVLFGPTARQYNDYFTIISQGWLPGVYFHVIGAETLRAGKPINLGWIPWAFAGLILGLLQLYLRSRKTLVFSVFTGLILFISVPIALDAMLITADIVPGFLLFAILTFRARSLRRVERARRINPRSGLPNLIALAEGAAGADDFLIAMRLRNHAQIVATYGESISAPMWRELARRVGIGEGLNQIYHGEDVLIWNMPRVNETELKHHLDGLRAILCTPFETENAVIDPLVSFGVDLQQGVLRSERVGPAIWCAEEAGDSRSPKFYDPGQRAQVQWELSLLGELDRGLTSGEVWIAFQPKVDLSSGEWSGFEALARWTHPQRGAVSPNEFIKLAERNDRLDRLTLFVLNEAISSVAAMQRLGIFLPVAVNISTRSVKGSDLVEMVKGILARHNVAAEYLVLEITETEAAKEPKELLIGLHQIAALGVGVSIDDFGSGNAGMEYLRSFPAREVKIDREFVSGLEHSARDALFVQSIVDLAHSTGRKVVAEGIESLAVYEVVKSLGCDTGQGFYLSEPLNFAEVVRHWRQAGARLTA